jgi:hypothetical protein
MNQTARYRLYLDLASSVLGVLAGILFVVESIFDLPSLAGVAAPVVVMGILGAGFSAVGVGHLYLEDDVRGMGEFVAGVGAMLVGLSFGVSQGIAVFAVGVVALVAGGLILLADSFGIEL